MNKYKKLISNSIIFTIGTFGSKLIGFVMVPLYTHFLSTSEYGTVDLINTTTSLLIPFLTLELGQAALRYAVELEDEINRSRIFNNISLHALIITLLIIITSPLIYYFNIFENYNIMFTILLILRIVNNLYSQYIRGIGLVKEFALNGILMTIVTVISNVILIVTLNYKVTGYILSLIISALISNIYLFYVSNGISRIKIANPNFELLKEMLVFSMPIIPNSAMWWIISSSTRYFILYFIGSAGNGIYAVANKIPGVISMATGIFSQAWHLSSFEEFDSENKDEFFTKIFNIYWTFLFLIGSLILVILKPLLSVIVDEAFYISWQIAPLLIFAVINQSFSSFLGTNYTAAKQTKGSFKTSIYAGITSAISNFILIPVLGLIGAGISSSISFFAMFIIRLVDTQKYAKIKINKYPFIFTNLIFIIQTIILFLTDDIILLVLELFLFIVLIMINKNTIFLLFKPLIKMLRKF